MKNQSQQISVMHVDREGKYRPVKVALLAAGCLILILCAGAFFLLHRQTARLKSTANQASVLQSNTQKYSATLNEATAASSKGQYTQAAGYWLTYAQSSTDKTDQIKAYQNAVAQFMSASQFKEALMNFQKAAAISGLNYNEAEDIAFAATRAGNKTLAIQYFQQAIKLIPSNIPFQAEQKQLFETSIRQLESEK